MFGTAGEMEVNDTGGNANAASGSGIKTVRDNLKRMLKAKKRTKTNDESSDTSALSSVSSVVHHVRKMNAKQEKKYLDLQARRIGEWETETETDHVEVEDKGEDDVAKMQRTTAELTKHLVMKCGISGENLLEALRIAAEYQETLVRVLMRGGTAIQTGQRNQRRRRNRSRSNGAAPILVPAARKKPTTEPKEQTKTAYAVIVKGGDGTTAEEVQKQIAACNDKVDIRVKSIRPTANGAVRIQTCSQSEMLSIKQCAAIKKAGLTVEDSVPAVPKFMVMDVESALETGLLMQELYKKNLKDVFAWEEFERTVHVVKRTKELEVLGNVILEVPEKVRAMWTSQRRIYLGWKTHQVRLLESSPGCHRCYALGHVMSQCRSKMVCRKCGQDGHTAVNCNNAESCRNCRLVNKPDAHSVTSVSRCPFLMNRRRGALPYNG